MLIYDHTFKMKRTIFFWLLSFHTISAIAQSRVADSLKLLLQKEEQDTDRVLLLAKLGTSYLFEKPEIGFTYAEQGLQLSRTINYKRGEATCLNALGHLNRVSGNYIAGIKYHMQALQICDTINDLSGIALSYFGIAGNYEDEKDYKEALLYYYKIKPIEESLNSMEGLGGIEVSVGLCYLHEGQLDSALKYEQNAYELLMNSQGKSIAIARLGSVHTAMNNYDVALSFYRMGIPIAMATSDNNALTELYSGIFTLFQKRQLYDSCIYYGKKELETADKSGSPALIAAACSDLFAIYKKINSRDSALKYLELASVTKDTLITQEKIKQQQLLSFQEESRQREKQAELKATAEKRKQDIQFAAIAIGVISLILLFFLLSRSIIINANWIRFLGVLVSFDFINLILHPYLSDYANDSPILMLCGLVIISAILVPLHHKIEKWVIEKMVEKNKAIRLAGARKTIEKLENKSGNV
jgi:tetratricopeptide (TPR) repeat protein